MRRYPIDGLMLTEPELARYFLGQLEIESHHRARAMEERTPLAIPNEPARTKDPAWKPPVRDPRKMSDDMLAEWINTLRSTGRSDDYDAARGEAKRRVEKAESVERERQQRAIKGI